MALNNWKKNLNRVGQKFNEKVAGFKGTQKGENYKYMTDQIDMFKKHLDELSNKTVEVLQPNPTIRAKMGAIGTFAKLRGAPPTNVYRQSEAELAEVMNKYGNSLGSQSVYGRALLDAGTSFVDLADLKYSNEDNIREYFLGPIHNMLSQDIKEINGLRKKCESRRLDYDQVRIHCEKSQKPNEVGLHEAQVSFEEAMESTTASMATFLNAEPVHIENLNQMVKSMMEYHTDAAKVLTQLHQDLQKRHAACEEQDGRYATSSTPEGGFGNPFADAESPPYSAKNGGTPLCKALYPFRKENANELQFEVDDLIELIEQVDANWYLGKLKDGSSGHFPVNYVEVLHPLPSG